MSTSRRPVPDAVPGPGLRIEVVRTGAGRGRVRVMGELDVTTAPRLRQALLAEIEIMAHEAPPRMPRLELDLSGVGFCAAAGLSVLLEARACAAGAGIGLALGRTSVALGRVLALCGLEQAIEAAPPTSAERA